MLEVRFATIISTSKFNADAEKLLTGDERAALEFSLAKEPDAHPVIPGLNGVRKARWATRGGGKRGGVRVIYFHAVTADVVALIAIYRKNKKEDLSDAEKKAINRFVEEYKKSIWTK